MIRKNNNFSITLKIGLLVLVVFGLFSVETALASTGNWYRDPFGIRDFVNSKGYSVPYLYNGQGAMNFDNSTAQKICQLAGYDDVATMDCSSSLGSGCGFYSCYDNVMAKWNTSSNNFDIINACTAGNKWISSLVCKNNTPVCTSHALKQCVGNSVYWFNSCNNQEDLFQACTSNQVCQNAQCVNVTCSINSNCGSNRYVGSPFCQGNNVYQNYRTYTCNNPGTANSSCSQSDTAQLQTNCTASQTCTSGSCTNINIVCSNNSNCGTNRFTGSPFCQGNNVYKNYITYTCNNPGTANSYCSNSTSAQLKNTCTGNQTCTNGSCSQSCSYHSYQQCLGNNLYWYDSCGNQQDLIQYCPNGCSTNSCSQQNYVSVQTNSATNIYSNQATLNGYLYNYNNYNNSAYVWFQWGTSTSYGYETQHQAMSYNGAFSQNITNVYSGTTYHFRAVAQPYNGNTVYGQDITFTAGGAGGMLTINKTVRNMTSGNSSWSSTAYANPSDTLMFMITIQATGNQNVNNVFARDTFPTNLIYRNQLVVSGSSNYSGDITFGISIGTISAGQTITITYQAQLASAQNFSYGTTTLNNNVSLTSSDSGYNPTSNAVIYVNRTAVYGASTISTGLTNNFLVDSFILPLIIALLGLWMFKAGMFVRVEKWIDNQKRNSRGYKASKELNSRIAKIRKAERT